MRKGVLAGLVLVITVLVTPVMAIGVMKTKVHMVGSGKVVEELAVLVNNGPMIADEGSVISGVNMNYNLNIVKDFSTLTGSKSITVTADEINANTWMTMGKKFYSGLQMTANDGAEFNYYTYGNHTSHEYIREIDVKTANLTGFSDCLTYKPVKPYILTRNELLEGQFTNVHIVKTFYANDSLIENNVSITPDDITQPVVLSGNYTEVAHFTMYVNKTAVANVTTEVNVTALTNTSTLKDTDVLNIVPSKTITVTYDTHTIDFVNSFNSTDTFLYDDVTVTPILIPVVQ